MGFEGERSPHEEERSPEKGEQLGVEFFVHDHAVRQKDEYAVEELPELYADMKRHGISSARFDVDWKEIAVNPGEEPNKEIIERYIGTIKAMKEVGLEPPTLILSAPPDWAQPLYKNDKEKYFTAYEEYISSVADLVKRSGEKVHSVQLFNEINHSFLFQYIDAEDLPRISKIVRERLGAVQPDIKLSTSLIVGNMNDTIAKAKRGETADEFITKNEKILKESLDMISLDFYPGVWHLPVTEAIPRTMRKMRAKFDAGKLGVKDIAKLPSNVLNDTFVQLGKVKPILERVASWGKEYEIGETGFPTNTPYSTEDRQRYFYDSFSRALRALLVDFKQRGIPLPSRVGLYEAQDEENAGFGGIVEKVMKIPAVQKLSGLTPNPEHDFGLRKKSGEGKAILRGRRLRGHKEGIEEELSQMKKIIHYVNRPISPSESNETKLI